MQEIPVVKLYGSTFKLIQNDHLFHLKGCCLLCCVVLIAQSSYACACPVTQGQPNIITKMIKKCTKLDLRGYSKKTAKACSMIYILRDFLSIFETQLGLD